MTPSPPTAARTAITGVRVFDGERLTPERTVVLEAGLITSADSPAAGDTLTDGRGGTLLPGLIDAHIHLHGPQTLDACARWGVTTGLDMASRPPTLVDSLRRLVGTCDIRSANSPASAPGSPQTTFMGFDASTALRGPHDAETFVQQRVDENSDYIKVIVEDPVARAGIALGPDTIAAIVDAAHRRGLRVFAHATTTGAYRLAADACVDVLTHAPVDQDLDGGLLALLQKRPVVCVPTLTMMKAVTALGRTAEQAAEAYGHSSAAVRAMHAAGIAVVAGTDANAAPGSPAPIAHGKALHDELALLVLAGLSPLEALRSATVLPARLFELPDRGAVTAGLRADLLLVDGDPTRDITATAAVRGVWIHGTQVR